jgi:hypothetical protein
MGKFFRVNIFKNPRSKKSKGFPVEIKSILNVLDLFLIYHGEYGIFKLRGKSKMFELITYGIITILGYHMLVVLKG